MKLRQLPEDFKVIEISKIVPLSEKADFKLYMLEKKGIESFAILRHLSKMNNIPLSELGIAGLKDKHAISQQYLTIPAKYELKTLEEQNMKLRFLGYAKEALKYGDLEANRFEVTVRDIKRAELDSIANKASSISQGVPNYFDSQRFGSVISNRFIAKCLIKKQYEQAVQLYLTQFTRNEKSRLKKEKKLILEKWNELGKLRIADPRLRKIVNEYKKTDSWLKAYQKIPSSLREMIISAYQSYLWNECVKKVLSSSLPPEKLYAVKYNIGSLLFFKNLSEGELMKIPPSFKTIPPDIVPSEFEKEIIDEILDKEGLAIADFDIRKETGSFFKMHERQVIIKPEAFSISSPQPDELNKDKFKIKLSFTLQKGAYATLITKRLFGK